MSIYLYKDNATELYVFKYKGFVFNPKPGSMMLIERESDGFVNLQAVYDNKAFRQNTNGHILNDFVDPKLILDGAGAAYGVNASDILSALSDFFVDAPASSGATDLLGGIVHNGTAPTPGVSGRYYFRTEGVCSWLPDSPYVQPGDEALVVYENAEYQYIFRPTLSHELIVYYDEDNDSVTVAVADSIIVSETTSPEGYEEITLTLQ